MTLCGMSCVEHVLAVTSLLYRIVRVVTRRRVRLLMLMRRYRVRSAVFVGGVPGVGCCGGSCLWSVPRVVRIGGVHVHWLPGFEPLPCAMRVACCAALCWLVTVQRIRVGGARPPPPPRDPCWGDVARVAMPPLLVT